MMIASYEVRLMKKRFYQSAILLVKVKNRIGQKINVQYQITRNA